MAQTDDENYGQYALSKPAYARRPVIFQRVAPGRALNP